jgi:hypothetical protein
LQDISLNQFSAREFQSIQANNSIFTAENNISRFSLGARRMEGKCLNGDTLKILEYFYFSLSEAEIKVIASFCHDDTMIASGIDMDVFYVDIFVFGGEYS